LYEDNLWQADTSSHINTLCSKNFLTQKRIFAWPGSGARRPVDTKRTMALAFNETTFASLKSYDSKRKYFECFASVDWSRKRPVYFVRERGMNNKAIKVAYSRSALEYAFKRHVFVENGRQVSFIKRWLSDQDEVLEPI
jgi:hypothetical protein